MQNSRCFGGCTRGSQRKAKSSRDVRVGHPASLTRQSPQRLLLLWKSRSDPLASPRHAPRHPRHHAARSLARHCFRPGSGRPPRRASHARSGRSASVVGPGPAATVFGLPSGSGRLVAQLDVARQRAQADVDASAKWAVIRRITSETRRAFAPRGSGWVRSRDARHNARGLAAGALRVLNEAAQPASCPVLLGSGVVFGQRDLGGHRDDEARGVGSVAPAHGAEVGLHRCG
jgi:hypothetical protein